MDRLHVDFSRIVRLDVPRLREKLPRGGPPRRSLGSIEETIVGGAIDAAAHASNIGEVLQEVADLARLASRVHVSLVGGRGPMVKGPASTSDITVGLGSSTSAFAGFGVTIGAGLYGSTTPELGIYTSGGGGYWTNVGVSGSFVATYVFGGPSAFGGLSWGVGIDCDIPGVGMGIGCMVLFGASGPPFELLGFSVSLGAGISALPASITFQVSSTHLRPLTSP